MARSDSRKELLAAIDADCISMTGAGGVYDPAFSKADDAV
jgi:hypothetical protein